MHILVKKSQTNAFVNEKRVINHIERKSRGSQTCTNQLIVLFLN